MPTISDTLDLFWFLATSGDGRYLGSGAGHRPAEVSYPRQIAVAADRLDFEGVMLPTGNACLDGWARGAALAPATERLTFLLAPRPGILTPGLAARQAAALDRIGDGRLFADGIHFTGRHLTARGARLGPFDSVRTPHPRLWFAAA